ncbi:putative protein kinase RLK-Pelle-WAK family [Helianthus annuus]|nr:putative protein kinase RLK-Pelle-WAK family [Helianthus annuus]
MLDFFLFYLNTWIQLDDIKLATNNFSDTYKDSDSDDYDARYTVELNHFDNGKPSFVEEKGKTTQPKIHNTVLIKRFLPRDDEDEEELFFRELEVLITVKHPNIVTLIGFCVEGFEMMLIVEKFANGFLMDYLGNVCTLTWETRLKICIDVAHALSYIHSGMEDKKMIIRGSRICEYW